jgi:sulfotransferase family protein
MNTKVFGIGFHKTGTKSLAAALELLGYSVTGPNGVKDPDIGRTVHDMARDLVPKFDAFQDNPWPLLYRELDERYAGSRFVLTIRPTEAWIRSVASFFGTDSTPMREWIYGVGSPKGNEDVFVERYERHNRDVLEHFRNRPEDLLVLRITEGEGWEKLCPFLGHRIPREAFPHEDPKSDAWAEKMAALRAGAAKPA